MKAIICDRCKSINDYKDITYVRANKMTSIDSFSRVEAEGYEICKECYDKLFSWTESKN